jgi:hypothetical protein
MPHMNAELTQTAWQAIAKGDYSLAWERLQPALIVENGPGAGPWRSLASRDELADLLLRFADIFAGTFRQEGNCLYADDRCSIVLVRETGTHAQSGERFDNTALYIQRLDSDSTVDRMWTVDLDTEAVESFWQRNPLPSSQLA